MALVSAWYRKYWWFYPPAWLLLYLCIFSSITQGALSSAVSKAFSSVNSQLTALKATDQQAGEQVQLTAGDAQPSISAVQKHNQQSVRNERAVALSSETELQKRIQACFSKSSNSDARAQALNSLALDLFHEGEFDNSVRVFEQSMLYIKTALGAENGRMSEALAGLGTVYSARRQMRKAITAYQKAVDIDKKFFGARHMIVAGDLRQQARAHASLNEFSTAERLNKEAAEIELVHPKPLQTDGNGMSNL
jgi:tetratricopeptide (TPR) repeat protein